MKSKKSLSTLVLVIIVVCVLLFQFINHTGPFSGSKSENTSTELKGKEKVHIDRVVDGDTFVAKQGNKNIKVRLIGVDTPETVKPNTPVQPYGKEALNYSKKTIV